MGCVFSSWETAVGPLTKPGSFPLKTITLGVEGSCAWQAPGLPCLAVKPVGLPSSTSYQPIQGTLAPESHDIQPSAGLNCKNLWTCLAVVSRAVTLGRPR